jgi:hypothetical protein
VISAPIWPASLVISTCVVAVRVAGMTKRLSA